MDELKYESPSCRVLATTKNISEDEFRALRSKGIGGSDAGAIMGLSSYASAFTVVADKLGLTKYEENKATKRGKRMEPVIRENFAGWAAEDEDGIQLEIYESPFLYQSVAHPWMVANIDGLVRHPVYGLCVLEIKTADQNVGKDWKDNSVPDSYYAQVQHYMAVLGLQMAVVGVMIGLDFEIRYVPYNASFASDMIESERHVWVDFVEKGQLPAPSGVDKEDDILVAKYATPIQESTDLSQYREKAARYVEINETLKPLEAEKKEISNFFKSVIGDAKSGLMPGYKATWSRFKQERFDAKTFRAENPEIAARYTTEVDADRLLISATK